ncbi:hypothetical protein NCU09054 [Neurospora crassa OR74A]|uniref:Uncharacterized protein n=1 Tax=Neurospora crassa (strain ATCC 24698 / 74-OR23-1A / CBS 708.71 / DSM 1257 / FGSC 987) TaxID=367110 RepID=Q7S1U5_NEUCR|nr:hypothetical protein NCU09054 [Neurospora crassa OR74A]EAA29322.1 hypothetical protein NCU09054 [Neurospora crassa OR74A]|eukprot:XP_958558.1 hypothetical protein NCU09054 [Neurospora crassa OR74A]
MSPSQSQSEVQDDQDESAPEPQQPRTSAPSHYQAVSFFAGTMPNAFDWQQRQIGSAQSGAMGQFTSPYNTLEAPGFDQNLNMTRPSITSPYTAQVQPAYPSPVMQHPAFQAQAVFGMSAGTHAAQASHSPLHYQSGVDPSLQQVHHNVFSPNQSIPGMPATGFQLNNNNSHNFMDHNHFIVPPMGPSMPSTYPEVPQPNDAALPANTNSWTTPQDDLVRRLKHEKKKVAQIKEELKREFGVVRSGNAISKRWKQIMKKDSEEESKALIQNVLPPPTQLQMLHTGLLNAIPEYASAQHDPQTALLISEIQEDFQKGFTKLVEMCVLKVQKVLRHGGANL